MSITAMKQALEALEKAVSTCFDRRAHEEVMSRPEHFINQTITALRTAIAEAEKQEPFGYFQYAPHFDAWVQNRDEDKGVAFYTTPPAAQRQWVGLTDEDKQTAVWTNGTFGAGALWAEAKLREKNT